MTFQSLFAFSLVLFVLAPAGATSEPATAAKNDEEALKKALQETPRPAVCRPAGGAGYPPHVDRPVDP